MITTLAEAFASASRDELARQRQALIDSMREAIRLLDGAPPNNPSHERITLAIRTLRAGIAKASQ